jgi:hypothetical protein
MSCAIATEIARQIGNRAFLMMGTQHKVAGERDLSFDIRGSRAWSHVRVTLTVLDLYDVTFIRIGRAPKRVRTEMTVPDVYNDDLKAVIERETGLFLSL